jgi:homoprotocatechuate degradation regulator HpaR
VAGSGGLSSAHARPSRRPARPKRHVTRSSPARPKAESRAPRGNAAGTADQAGGASIRPFQRSLPMLLMLAREAVMQRFRTHLRAHNMTEQQWRIIRVLAETDGADMLSLSARSLIQPSSLSRTIPLLVQRGIVTRRADHGDQRRILVSLTGRGKQLFRVMSEESVGIYASLEADIGPRRIADLYRLLDDMIEAIGFQPTDTAEEP